MRFEKRAGAPQKSTSTRAQPPLMSEGEAADPLKGGGGPADC